MPSSAHGKQHGCLYRYDVEALFILNDHRPDKRSLASLFILQRRYYLIILFKEQREDDVGRDFFAPTWVQGGQHTLQQKQQLTDDSMLALSSRTQRKNP